MGALTLRSTPYGSECFLLQSHSSQMVPGHCVLLMDSGCAGPLFASGFLAGSRTFAWFLAPEIHPCCWRVGEREATTRWQERTAEDASALLGGGGGVGVGGGAGPSFPIGLLTLVCATHRLQSRPRVLLGLAFPADCLEDFPQDPAQGSVNDSGSG